MAHLINQAFPIANFVPTPAAPTVTPTGGAAAAWGYKLLGEAADGTLTPLGPEGTTAAGAADLDVTHYNTVTWTDPLNAVKVHIYRTTQPGGYGGTLTTGHIGTVLAGVQTFRDNAVVSDSETAPSANQTGQGAKIDSSIFNHFTVYFRGTFVASLQLQLSDDGVHWVNEGIAQGGAVAQQVSAQAPFARILMTAYTSGAPVAICVGRYSTTGG